MDFKNKKRRDNHKPKKKQFKSKTKRDDNNTNDNNSDDDDDEEVSLTQPKQGKNTHNAADHAHFADQIPCDKGRPFEQATLEYFNTMIAAMKDLDKSPPDERAIMIRTIFNELKGWEYRVLTRPSFSILINDCLRFATPSQVKTLFADCLGKFGNLLMHRESTHTMQTLLVRVADVLAEEHLNKTIVRFSASDDAMTNDSDSDEDDKHGDSDGKKDRPMLNLFLEMCAEIRQYWPILMSNMHASFITRCIIFIITGCVQITKSMVDEANCAPLNKTHLAQLKQIKLDKISQNLNTTLTNDPSAMDSLDSHKALHGQQQREVIYTPKQSQQQADLKSITRAHVRGCESVLKDLVLVVNHQIESNQWTVVQICQDPYLSPVLVCLLHCLTTIIQSAHTVQSTINFVDLQDTLVLMLLKWRYTPKVDKSLYLSLFNTMSPYQESLPQNKTKQEECQEALCAALKVDSDEKQLKSVSDILSIYQMQSGAQQTFQQLIQHPAGSRLLEQIIQTADPFIATNIYYKYIRSSLTLYSTDLIANHVVQALIPKLPLQLNILHNIIRDILELEEDGSVPKELLHTTKSSSTDDFSSNTFYAMVAARQFGIIYKICLALELPTGLKKRSLLPTHIMVLNAFSAAFGINTNQTNTKQPHAEQYEQFVLHLAQLDFFPWLLPKLPIAPNMPFDCQHLGVMSIVSMFSWPFVPQSITGGFKSLIETHAKVNEANQKELNPPQPMGNKTTKVYTGPNQPQNKQKQQQKEDRPPVLTKLIQLLKSQRGCVLIEYFLNSPHIDDKLKASLMKGLSGSYTTLILDSAAAARLIQTMYFLPQSPQQKESNYNQVMLEVRMAILKEITMNNNMKMLRTNQQGSFTLETLHCDHFLRSRQPWVPSLQNAKKSQNVELFSDIFGTKDGKESQKGKRKAKEQLIAMADDE